MANRLWGNNIKNIRNYLLEQGCLRRNLLNEKHLQNENNNNNVLCVCYGILQISYLESNKRCIIQRKLGFLTLVNFLAFNESV